MTSFHIFNTKKKKNVMSLMGMTRLHPTDEDNTTDEESTHDEVVLNNEETNHH